MLAIDLVYHLQKHSTLYVSLVSNYKIKQYTIGAVLLAIIKTYIIPK